MNIGVLLPDDEVRASFLPPGLLVRLEGLGEVVMNPTATHYTEEELRSLLPTMDAVITGWGCAKIGANVLDAGGPGFLGHVGGTVAPYVDGETYARGIQVVSANEVYARSVAEGTLAYMLMGLRRIPAWCQTLQQGGWRGDTYDCQGLLGKRVGLVSYGAITRHLLQMLQPFGLEILLYSGHLEDTGYEALGVQKASLTEIFSSCDVVSLHSALTEKTRGLVSRGLLASMRPGALLVNTARGAIVDEKALVEELQRGKISAVLDVFSHEPLDAGSPLRQLDNAYLLPHIAGPTMDQRPEAGRLVVDELERWLRREPLRYAIPAAAVSHMTSGG